MAGNRDARRMYVLVVPHATPLAQATDNVLFLRSLSEKKVIEK